MEKSQRHNICILGSEASGKTCFIAALAALGQVRGDGDFVIAAPEDSNTQTWLNNLSRSLNGGTWPPSTTATSMFEFSLEYAGAPFHLTIMDYSGEAFRRVFDNLDPESLASLQEHLFQADTIFILLDPVADLNALGTDIAGEEHREKRLSALFNAVVKCVHMDKRDDANDERDDANKALGKHIALLVTKADCVAANIRKKGAKALIRKAVPKFYETARKRSASLKCFFISAIGGDNSGAGPLASPPVPIAPEGYDLLFRWLSWSWKWRGLKRMALPVALSVVVVLVALAGLYFYEGWKLSIIRDPSASESSRADASRGYLLRKDEAQRLIDSHVKERLNAIRDNLENAVTFQEITQLRTSLEELSRYDNHTYSNEFTRAHKEIDDKAQDLHYERITSAPTADEQLAAIAEYRKEYPRGRYKEEIDKLELAAHDTQGGRQRQEINRIIPGQDKRTWPDFLLKKATAVDGFRKDRAPSHLREGMEKGANLARRLAANSSYKVTAISARTLADSRETVLIVSVNGQEVLQTGRIDHSIPNWHKEATVTWRPGDKIRVEWRYEGWYPDGPIAELESDALDSLRNLSGTVELKRSDKQSYLDNSRPPTASFSIEGDEFANWADFAEFIFPGGYWIK